MEKFVHFHEHRTCVRCAVVHHFLVQVGTAVLDNCSRTADLNDVAASCANDGRGVVVRELDWFNPHHSLVANGKDVKEVTSHPEDHASRDQASASANELSQALDNEDADGTITAALSQEPYAWEPADVECFQAEATILLAADTVYSDTATTAFGHCAQQLLAARGPSRTLYLALQKRINFSLDELAVVAPAYDHFLQAVVALPGLKADRMETGTIPQVFSYARTPELELWRVTRA